MMTSRTLVATTFALASIPLTIGVLVWHGALHRRDLNVDFDPFEIDLQLCDRNDDPLV